MKASLQNSLYHMILVRVAKTYLGQRWSLNLLFMFMSILACAQSGIMKITTTDEKTKEPIPFATAQVLQKGLPVASGTADFDGEIIIKSMRPGVYNVKVQYVGYKMNEYNDVRIMEDKTTYISPRLSSDGAFLDKITVTDCKVPLIDPNVKSGGSVCNGSDLLKLADKNVYLVSNQVGVYQDREPELNIRSCRGNAGSTYFVDGERVIGRIGALSVKVTDEETKDPVPFANVIIEKDGEVLMGATVNEEGILEPTAVGEGTYKVKVSYLGYTEKTYDHVHVKESKPTNLNVRLKNNGISLDPVVFVDYAIPFIESTTTCGGSSTHCFGWGCGTAGYTQSLDSTWTDSLMDADESRGTLAKHSTVLLYPNPTNGRLNVEARGYMDNILLFDMNGRLVEQYPVKGKKAQLDLSRYQEGTYILRYPEKGTWNADRIILVRN